MTGMWTLGIDTALVHAALANTLTTDPPEPIVDREFVSHRTPQEQPDA